MNGPIDPKDLKSFYKFLTPRDLVGNPSISMPTDSGPAAAESLPVLSVYNAYMSKTTANSGNAIIKSLKKPAPEQPEAEAGSMDKLSANGKGALWNTLYQQRGSADTIYLDYNNGDDKITYWHAYRSKGDVEDPTEAASGQTKVAKIVDRGEKNNHARYELLKQKRDNHKRDNNKYAFTAKDQDQLDVLEKLVHPAPPPPPPATSASPAAAPPRDPNLINPPSNFYSTVMGLGSENDGPPVSFSINILRTPLLNETSRGANEVEFFLNHIPSYFASNMVPYLDVEFQYPKGIVSDGKKLNLDRPSLLRFLVGSEYKLPENITAENINAYLTSKAAADYSLIFNVKTPKRLPDGPDADGQQKRDNTTATFTGMEMFTTPQTLTNMENLNGGDGNSGRLNNVQPFLPPASLIGASIAVANAGAGMFAHRTATIDMKIHDKNRLVEFSEFFRGPSGNRELIVWLTFGWLASRTTDDEADYYAKFINENMLTREAYSVKNASYTFDPTGQCSVKLDLVSKGINSAQTTSIDIADDKDFRTQMHDAAETLQFISENRGIFGDPPTGANQEIRIYQILDSAASGNLQPDFKKSEIQAQIAAANTALANRKDLNEDAKLKARGVLNAISKVYGLTSSDGSLTQQLKKAAANFIDKKIKFCEGLDSPDPFLPDANKQGPNRVYEGFTLFTDDLVKHTHDAAGKKDQTATKTKKKK